MKTRISRGNRDQCGKGDQYRNQRSGISMGTGDQHGMRISMGIKTIRGNRDQHGDEDQQKEQGSADG